MSDANGADIMIEPSKEVLAAAVPAPAVPRMFMFVPKDLSELMKYAEMVAASPFVPKGYAGNAGACLVAMQFGAELGLPPLQALQNIAVINGKPGIYGDLGKALLYSKGFKIEERDMKEVKAKNEALAKVTRPNGEVTERTFSLEDATVAKLWGKEGPWTNYPYRQMAWRAFWFAARDGAADVLKGIWGIEELQDYKADAIETTVTENVVKRASEKLPPIKSTDPDQAKVDAAMTGQAPDAGSLPPPVPVPAAPPKKETPPTRTQAHLEEDSARHMKAKFTAPCRQCTKPIQEGTEMIYAAQGSMKGAYHVECVAFVG